MKGLKLKYFALGLAALLLFSPAIAMAKGPKISFSLNLFPSSPGIIVQERAPIFYERVYVPCRMPTIVEKRVIVKEYHHWGCECPACCETLYPHYPYPFYR